MLKYIITDYKFIVSASQMEFCGEPGVMESKL